MLKIVLLMFGFVMLLIQHFIPFETSVQSIIFIVGILIVGVPHGAADFLVASQNALLTEKVFSTKKFFTVYLGRLILFGLVLSIFPLVGIILFLFFAAFHFGETDLHKFKTNTLLGKILVITYGVVILSVIVLHHFDEVIPILRLFEAGKQSYDVINWFSQKRYLILSINGIIFFISTFIYFLKNSQIDEIDKGQFLIRFALILFILFNLPMLMGFTFYFVLWHSILSLKNIVLYLRKKNTVTYKTIAKQILLYSFIALLGIFLFGLSGFMFVNENSTTAYIFIGLAVLTAPHMEIMYEMYGAIRQKKQVSL